MKNRKLLLIIALAAAAFFVTTHLYGQTPKVLQLDPLIKEFKILEAEKTAKYGIDKRPPGGGGAAFYTSNCKVPNDIRMEVAFFLKEHIDASKYAYIVFDMMGDTWEVMNDINEHYPRFRDNDEFVQFQGSFLFRGEIDKNLNGAKRKWITVSVPIIPFNIHENRPNYAAVMANTNIFLLRFIANRAPIKGNIYFRNIRLQMEP